MKHWLRLLLLAVVVAVGATAVLHPAARQTILQLVEKVRSLGPWGPVALAGMYVLAAVLLVPGSLLTLAAGFLFGVVRGTAAVSVGSTLGAVAAFLLGRFVARNWVDRIAARNPKFAAVDRAIGEQSFVLVLLIRFSPVFPYSILNYLFGATRVRLAPYALASWLGMLPGTVLYVYIGSLLGDLSNLTTGSTAGQTQQRVFLAIGLVATIAVTALVTRFAREALRKAILETKPPEDA